MQVTEGQTYFDQQYTRLRNTPTVLLKSETSCLCKISVILRLFSELVFTQALNLVKQKVFWKKTCPTSQS